MPGNIEGYAMKIPKKPMNNELYGFFHTYFVVQIYFKELKWKNWRKIGKY